MVYNAIKMVFDGVRVIVQWVEIFLAFIQLSFNSQHYIRYPQAWLGIILEYHPGSQKQTIKVSHAITTLYPSQVYPLPCFPLLDKVPSTLPY